ARNGPGTTLPGGADPAHPTPLVAHLDRLGAAALRPYARVNVAGVAADGRPAVQRRRGRQHRRPRVRRRRPPPAGAGSTSRRPGPDGCRVSRASAVDTRPPRLSPPATELEPVRRSRRWRPARRHTAWGRPRAASTRPRPAVRIG